MNTINLSNSKLVDNGNSSKMMMTLVDGEYVGVSAVGSDDCLSVYPAVGAIVEAGGERVKVEA